jgi:molecular chaperone DnaK
VRPLIADLQQIVQALPAAAASGAGAGAAQAGGDGGPATEGDEEVIDAEFTRE